MTSHYLCTINDRMTQNVKDKLKNINLKKTVQSTTSSQPTVVTFASWHCHCTDKHNMLFSELWSNLALLHQFGK